MILPKNDPGVKIYHPEQTKRNLAMVAESSIPQPSFSEPHRTGTGKWQLVSPKLFEPDRGWESHFN